MRRKRRIRRLTLVLIIVLIMALLFPKKRIEKTEYTSKTLIHTIIDEIQCFPVDYSDNDIYYTDSWGYERTYGGNRKHEGTDIMDTQNSRGRLEVISMTDGVVENLGWNEKGGWRVGIRTDSGNYYYYAHLAEFKKNLKEGDLIKAGDLLGKMGDSGYSQIEGTTGNFDVHLHIGIYYKSEEKSQIAINPYPFLKIIEFYNT